MVYQVELKIKCRKYQRTVKCIVTKQWYFPNHKGEGKILGMLRIKEHKQGILKPKCSMSGKRLKKIIGYQSDPQGVGSGVSYKDVIR